jgi:fido (protein-threonine AMPylation protein)
MDNFEEYLRQGEPIKADKAKDWKTAIGLQKVDGLIPSAYLLETARKNIEGDITILEVKNRIDSYYIQHPAKNDDSRTEEADKVSARITEILGEKTFTFSPAEYLTMHRRLFHGIYSHAGKIRDYNITKQEWVLNGETVLYASAESLKATLEYDLEQEKKFNYKGLSQQETIEHIVDFISWLWQIHVFGEGNTRTTAIFLIKYLRTFGFEVNNELFEQYSWYFRNALVRANYKNHKKNIYASNEFLLRFFENLLSGKNHILKNREMHVHYILPVNDTVKMQDDTVNDTVFNLIKLNTKITAAEISQRLSISLSTSKRKIKELKEQGVVARIGSDKTGYWKIIEQ